MTLLQLFIIIGIIIALTILVCVVIVMIQRKERKLEKKILNILDERGPIDIGRLYLTGFEGMIDFEGFHAFLEEMEKKELITSTAYTYSIPGDYP